MENRRSNGWLRAKIRRHRLWKKYDNRTRKIWTTGVYFDENKRRQVLLTLADGTTRTSGGCAGSTTSGTENTGAEISTAAFATKNLSRTAAPTENFSTWF